MTNRIESHATEGMYCTCYGCTVGTWLAAVVVAWLSNQSSTINHTLGTPAALLYYSNLLMVIMMLFTTDSCGYLGHKA